MGVEVAEDVSEPSQVDKSDALQRRKRSRWVVVTWLVVGAMVALGYKVVPFYYYYYDLRAACELVIRNAAVESDEEIRRNLLPAIQRVGIDKGPSDIGIHRLGGRIRIWVSYEELLEISIGGQRIPVHRFRFTPSAERVYED
jgi:hypothetical protein